MKERMTLDETLAPTEDPCEQFTVEEVRNAIHFAKNGKQLDLRRWRRICSGEAGVRWVTDLCNAERAFTVRKGVVPKDWRKSWMLSIYKGKGDVWTMVAIDVLN